MKRTGNPSLLRSQDSADFKTKLVAALLRGALIQAQLASELGVHPVQIKSLNREALEGFSGVFVAHVVRMQQEREAVDSRRDGGQAVHLEKR